MKLPTIRDVARQAGVSPASVSRHLNKTLRVPPEMGQRIDEAVSALGYRPNIMARRLSLGASETIALVTSDIAAPFFAAIASAAEDEADRHGYSLLICNSRNQASREVACVDKVRAGHFDGVIVLTNHPDNGTLSAAIRRTKRVVLVDEDVPGTDVPKILAENFDGGYGATRHLIDNGHRVIAHISGPRGLVSVEERLDGYRAAMMEAGLPVDERLIRCGAYDATFGAEAFRSILAGPVTPTAIFTTSDLIALAIYEVARDLGIRIPADLSVVGFDDLPFVGFLEPPLTTVRQPAAEFGRAGVRALLAREPGPVPVRRLPVTLVKRGSVARLDGAAAPLPEPLTLVASGDAS